MFRRIAGSEGGVLTITILRSESPKLVKINRKDYTARGTGRKS